MCECMCIYIYMNLILVKSFGKTNRNRTKETFFFPQVNYLTTFGLQLNYSNDFF